MERGGVGLGLWTEPVEGRSFIPGQETENRAVSTYYVRGSWAKLHLECLF